MNSEKRLARITGVLYLVIFIANMSVAFLISPTRIAGSSASGCGGRRPTTRRRRTAGSSSSCILSLYDRPVVHVHYRTLIIFTPSCVKKGLP